MATASAMPAEQRPAQNAHTQKRTPKLSAAYYADVIRRNAVA
jgi:hypothetical protein